MSHQVLGAIGLAFFFWAWLVAAFVAHGESPPRALASATCMFVLGLGLVACFVWCFGAAAGAW